MIQQTLCQQMTHFSRPAVNSTAALVLRSLSDEPEIRAQTVILYVFIRSPMTSSLSRHPAFYPCRAASIFATGRPACRRRTPRPQRQAIAIRRAKPVNGGGSQPPRCFAAQPGARLSRPGSPYSDRLSPLTHYLNAPANPPVSEVNAKVTELNAATLNALNGEQFMLQLYRQLPFNNPAYRQLAAWLTTPLKALYCNTARSAKIAPASAAR